MTDIVKTGISRAQRSLCRFKICAIGFDRKGELLGYAINSPFVSAKGRGFHAEVNLIKRYGKIIKKIILVRTNNHGGFLPIDPCANCQKLCNKLGISVHGLEFKKF